MLHVKFDSERWKFSLRSECPQSAVAIDWRNRIEFPLYVKCMYEIFPSFMMCPFRWSLKSLSVLAKNFFFNTGPFALIATVISRSFLRGQAGRPRFSRPKHRLRRQIGIRWGEEIDSWERRRVYLFVFLNVRASVHGELTAYLPAYLRIFLSRARSCPRVGACAATVIARMPYDTGEIGSFGTNRPYEPLSRCISKAVSNCARSLACSLARVRADTARFKHQMLDITLH